MSFYEFEGGAGAVVHEGRYRLGRFNRFLRATCGFKRSFSAEELLRYHFAILRGGAPHFGKAGGMSIYGQADPALCPLALKLAYDMGARYLWFWTSDHEHHVPWPEQLELSKIVKLHRSKAPLDLPGNPMSFAIKLSCFLTATSWYWNHPHLGEIPKIYGG